MDTQSGRDPTNLTDLLPDFIAARFLLETQSQVIVLRFGPNDERVLRRQTSPRSKTLSIVKYQSDLTQSDDLNLLEMFTAESVKMLYLLFLICSAGVDLGLQQQ